MSKETKFDGLPIAIILSILGFILVSISISVAFGNSNTGLAIVLAIISCTMFLGAVIFYMGDKLIKVIRENYTSLKKEN